jgi:hypothetical protein
VVAQLLPRREAADFGEVRLHQHLLHSQGNPSATTDAALDGVEDTTTRVLEALLPGAWLNPQEVEESVHRCTEML